MTTPRVTIGIVSCNRLHFLTALVASARHCIRYPELEWIIVDNASVEPGLREFVESLNFVDHKIFRDSRSPATEHVEGMNTIVEMCQSDYLMILPEDVQFVVAGEWMRDLVDVLDRHRHLGGIVFNAQRRETIRDQFAQRTTFWGLGPSRRPTVYRSRNDREFFGYGKTKPGIIGAGILSFARTDVWRALGLWRATGQQTVADSSGGGEAEMLRRYHASGLQLERCLARLPVAVEIITDPVGSKARVRGNRRYGAYWAPPQGEFYYRVWEEREADARFLGHDPAPGFEDIAEPLGFQLPLDAGGNLLKNPHVKEDDPFEWIHPSLAGSQFPSS